MSPGSEVSRKRVDLALNARLCLFAVAVASTTTGCSSSFWTTAVQGAAYDKCQSIMDRDERERCKKANFPDEDKYTKERAAPD